MSSVWRHGPTQRSERLLLLAVADHADEKGIAWPSTTTLAAKACMTTRTVSRALDYLKSEGWLEVLPRTGQHGCHTYKLNLAKLNPGGNTSPDKLSARRGDKMSDRRGPSPDKMSGREAEVDQTFTPLDQTFSTPRSDISDILNNIVVNHQNHQEELNGVPPFSTAVEVFKEKEKKTSFSFSACAEREEECRSQNGDQKQKRWTPEDYVRCWNEHASILLPEVRTLTGKRLAKLRKRIKEGMTPAMFATAIKKLNESKFHLGENDRNWKADFDFVITKEKLDSLLEWADDSPVTTASRRGQNKVVTKSSLPEASSPTAAARSGKAPEPPITPEMIAKRVQIEAGIVTDKAFRVLCDVARREQSLGNLPDAIVSAMSKAWQKLQHERQNLEYAWGAEAFFGEGNWRDPRVWPWKEGKKPPMKTMPTNDELLRDR